MTPILVVRRSADQCLASAESSLHHYNRLLATTMPSEPIPIGRSPPSQSGMPSSGSPTQPWAGSAVGLSTSTPGSLFGKWNAFSSVTKSPTNSTSVRVNPVNAGDSPPTASTTHSQQLDIPHHEDDHFDHDSLEFGDLADLKNRGWAAAAAARGQRRAVSMSLSPTTPLQNQANGGAIATSPNFGVLTDKMARGNGVLRRLSLSSGFTKVSYHAAAETELH